MDLSIKIYVVSLWVLLFSGTEAAATGSNVSTINEPLPPPPGFSVTCLEGIQKLSKREDGSPVLSPSQLISIRDYLRPRVGYDALSEVIQIGHGGQSIALRLSFTHTPIRQVLVLLRNPNDNRAREALNTALNLVRDIRTSGVDPEGVSHLPNYREELVRVDGGDGILRAGAVWEEAIHGTLDTFIEHNDPSIFFTPQGIRRLLGIGKQIALGLRAIHRKEFVHGDMKAENIFISQRRLEDGRHVPWYIVGDLGMSGLAGTYPPAVTPPSYFGTPTYWNPQRVRGGPLETESDIDQFKLVWAELLAGRRFSRSLGTPNPMSIFTPQELQTIPHVLLSILIIPCGDGGQMVTAFDKALAGSQ